MLFNYTIMKKKKNNKSSIGYGASDVEYRDRTYTQAVTDPNLKNEPDLMTEAELGIKDSEK